MGKRGKLNPSGIHRRFKKLIHEAGISSSFSFHSLRHGYATRIMSKGVSLTSIRDQLGHSIIAATSAYLHFTEEFKDKIKKIT